MTLRTRPDERITVLLVEDNPGDQRLIQEYLREFDHPQFSAIAAESLEEACSEIAKDTFAAILLDLNLPDSQGLATIERIRSHAPHQPTIVLTGMADIETGLAAIERGAEDYLTKDQLDTEMLRRAIVYSVQRNQARRAYQEMAEIHGLILESISDAVLITDDEGRFTYVGPNAWNIFGYRPNEIHTLGRIERLLGRKIDVHGLDDATEISNIAHQIVDRQGNRHELLINVKRVAINNGTMLFTCRDVTDRVEAQRQLETSQQHLQAIFDNALDAILLADDDGRFVDVNRAACELLGYARDELIGMTLWEIMCNDHRQSKADWAQLLQQGQQRGDFNFQRHDGRTLDVEYRTAAHIQPGLHLSVLRDITERRRVERQLAASQQFTQSVLDSLSANIAVLDEEGVIISTNAAWQEYAFHNGVSDLSRVGVGVNYLEVCRNAEGEQVEEAGHAAAGIEAVIAGEETTFEMEYPAPAPEDEDQWFLMHVAPFTGAKHGVVISHLDITERKRAEAELLQHVDRLTTVNHLEWELTTQSAPKQIHEQTATAISDLIPDIANVLISAYDADKSLIHLEYGVHDGEPVDVTAFEPIPLASEESGPQSDVIHSGQTMTVNDAREELLDAPIPFDEGEPNATTIRSALMAPMTSQGETIGVLQVQSRTPYRFTEADKELLALIANTAAVSLENVRLFDALQTANDELRNAYDATIAGWAKALELKDKETEGHTQRVAKLTLDLARQFGFTDDGCEHVYRGALLHDIGKMGVPDDILHKPGQLDGDEWDIIKQHPVHAYELLNDIDFLQPALAIPHCHHERWDGAGYPQGLEGEQIPLEARIFAVVDAYDAMTNDRPYRDALPHDEATRRLQENAGTQFDPDVVEAFVVMMDNEAP